MPKQFEATRKSGVVKQFKNLRCTKATKRVKTAKKKVYQLWANDRHGVFAPLTAKFKKKVWLFGWSYAVKGTGRKKVRPDITAAAPGKVAAVKKPRKPALNKNVRPAGRKACLRLPRSCSSIRTYTAPALFALLLHAASRQPIMSAVDATASPGVLMSVSTRCFQSSEL